MNLLRRLQDPPRFRFRAFNPNHDDRGRFAEGPGGKDDANVPTSARVYHGTIRGEDVISTGLRPQTGKGRVFPKATKGVVYVTEDLQTARRFALRALREKLHGTGKYEQLSETPVVLELHIPRELYDQFQRDPTAGRAIVPGAKPYVDASAKMYAGVIEPDHIVAVSRFKDTGPLSRTSIGENNRHWSDFEPVRRQRAAAEGGSVVVYVPYTGGLADVEAFLG